MAKLDFYGVRALTNGSLDDLSDQGSVEICEGVACNADTNTFLESVWLTFRAVQGRHYAFDCRITGIYQVYYDLGMGVNNATGHARGNASVSNDGHVVFASGAMPTDGELKVVIFFQELDAPVYTGPLIFWGCDVSSY